MSLIESVIPTCFKQTTIVPVPKNTKATCQNDYRPVALASVTMKCFERLAMAHINTIIPGTLDPLQFAYHPNRSTDDAISIALHTALSHLDKRNTYVRASPLLYSLFTHDCTARHDSNTIKFADRSEEHTSELQSL